MELQAEVGDQLVLTGYNKEHVYCPVIRVTSRCIIAKHTTPSGDVSLKFRRANGKQIPASPGAPIFVSSNVTAVVRGAK